jgi:hypothetical protein
MFGDWLHKLFHNSGLQTSEERQSALSMHRELITEICVCLLLLKRNQVILKHQSLQALVVHTQTLLTASSIRSLGNIHHMRWDT